MFFIQLQDVQEWSVPIQNKTFSASAKKLPTVMAENKLDIGAFKSKLNGKPVVVVRIRNGKNKMGASSIQLKNPLSVGVLQYQRVDIAKPMSVITKKKDGRHLFETFVNSGKTYQIFYHVKQGKLDPKLTISTVTSDEALSDDK